MIVVVAITDRDTDSTDIGQLYLSHRQLEQNQVIGRKHYIILRQGVLRIWIGWQCGDGDGSGDDGGGDSDGDGVSGSSDGDDVYSRRLGWVIKR
jgi:hypothetical protein